MAPEPRDFLDSRVFLDIARVIRMLEAAVRPRANRRALDSLARRDRAWDKVFRSWAGVPYASFVESTASAGSVYAAAHSLRLGGADRLADRVIAVAASTSAPRQRGGAILSQVVWGRSRSPFGDCLLAESERGLCHLEFFDATQRAFVDAERSLAARGWTATGRRDDRYASSLARRVFARARRAPPLPVHLHGSPFQREVWHALLALDSRSVIAYGALAANLGRAGAARAVGSAVGQNRIGWLVPCHHVVTGRGLGADGLGGFHWGVDRKRSMLVWESVSPAS